MPLAVLVALVIMAIGGVATSLDFLRWLYRPGKIPSLREVLQHMRALRTVLHILLQGEDALDQMVAEARRWH